MARVKMDGKKGAGETAVSGLRRNRVFPHARLTGRHIDLMLGKERKACAKEWQQHKDSPEKRDPTPAQMTASAASNGPLT
ncbi:hypothetical protein [Sphingobium sp.]|uniref:hypothetical protein n=1 Tax=Sphingobium sp. TaxID=1912891 RepID=UPI0026075093|nr:hypothetical protein [Sphingobium sp.]